MDYFKYRHSEAKELKDGLMSLIHDNISEGLYNDTGEDGKRTSQYLHKEHSDHPELSALLSWLISNPMIHANHKFAGNTTQYDSDLYNSYHNQRGQSHMGGNVNYVRKNFRVTQCWGNIFNKGQGLINHNHYPYTLAFSYYVNLPEGSPPIIINDEPIDIEEGQVILFPANQMHYVSNSDIDNRYAIVGNILYYYTE